MDHPFEVGDEFQVGMLCFLAKETDGQELYVKTNGGGVVVIKNMISEMWEKLDEVRAWRKLGIGWTVNDMTTYLKDAKEANFAFQILPFSWKRIDELKVNVDR